MQYDKQGNKSYIWNVFISMMYLHFLHSVSKAIQRKVLFVCNEYTLFQFHNKTNKLTPHKTHVWKSKQTDAQLKL